MTTQIIIASSIILLFISEAPIVQYLDNVYDPAPYQSSIELFESHCVRFWTVLADFAVSHFPLEYSLLRQKYHFL